MIQAGKKETFAFWSFWRGIVKAIMHRVGNVTELIQRDTQQSAKVALSPFPGPVGFGMPYSGKEPWSKEVWVIQLRGSKSKSTNFLGKKPETTRGGGRWKFLQPHLLTNIPLSPNSVSPTAFSERPLWSPKSRMWAQPTKARSGTCRKSILGGVSWGCPAEHGVQSLKPLQCSSLS